MSGIVLTITLLTWAFLYVIFRRSLVQFSSIAIFVFLTFILNYLGLILYFQFPYFFIKSFAVFPLKEINDLYVAKAAVILTSGVVIAVFSYSFCILAFGYGFGFPPVFSKEIFKVKLSNNLSRNLLILFGLGAFAIVFLQLDLVSMFRSFVVSGGHHRYQALILGRREFAKHYLSVLLVYNVIPAVSVALFLATVGKSVRYKILPILFSAGTIILLLLTFQKRPLLIYLVSLSLVYALLFSYKNKTQLSAIFYRYKRFPMLLVGMMILLLLFYLYYSNYLLGHSIRLLISAIAHSLVAMLSRIVGRLSLSQIFYVSYFPNVHDFFLVGNVKMVAKLFNQPLFFATKEVYQYYVKQKGTFAIPAITDLYGGFGAWGVVVGGFLFGAFFAFVDTIIASLKFTTGRIFLTTYAAVFAYYLTQANLFESLLGYGGVFFFIVWLVGSCKLNLGEKIWD